MRIELNSLHELLGNYLFGVGECMTKTQICLHLALLLLSILATTRKKLLRGGKKTLLAK